MIVRRLAQLALVVGLACGSAALTPAEASGWVKYGSSGHAYHWQSGC